MANEPQELPGAEATGPKVKATPTLSKGQKVKHPDGYTYKVLEVHKEGIRLEGVANLVSASVLKPVGAEPEK